MERPSVPVDCSVTSGSTGRETSVAANHALGRSRGGLGRKIHAAVDGRGRPLVILLTPGQPGDAPIMLPLLAGLRMRLASFAKRSCGAAAN